MFGISRKCSELELDPIIAVVDTSIIDRITVENRRHVAFWLGILLCLSALLGIYHLDENPYVLDEMWTIEFTMGSGNLHQHLPVNTVINPPPPFYSLNHAPAWWHLWTHMEITHPPLYAIFLRWWENAFGDSDMSGRLFSVTASLVAVAAIFDVVRLQSSLSWAVWAGLLMTVACPQVEYSRITRGYTMLTAVTLVAANAMTRLQLYGYSRRRIAVLTLAIFATAFTHYFAAGTLLALLAYAWLKIPLQRRAILLVYLIVGVIFAVAWGPFMWKQRHLFATDDPSTSFLISATPNHATVTFLRCLIAPVILLFPINPSCTYVAAIIGAAIYLAPFIPKLFRKNSFILLWGLWLAGTIAVVATMDFTRRTDHLYFIRYIILAGPAVYALIPLVFATFGRRIGHIASLAAVIGCMVNLSGVYARNPEDPRALVRGLISPPGVSDLLVVACSPADVVNAGIELLRVSRYLDPFNCPVVLLTGTADSQIVNAARKSRYVFLLTRDADPGKYFPGAKLINTAAYRGLGFVCTLRMNIGPTPGGSK